MTVKWSYFPPKVHSHISNCHPNFFLPNAQCNDESSCLVQLPHPLSLTHQNFYQKNWRQTSVVHLLSNHISPQLPTVLTSMWKAPLNWSGYNSFQEVSLVSNLLNIVWFQYLWGLILIVHWTCIEKIELLPPSYLLVGMGVLLILDFYLI